MKQSATLEWVSAGTLARPGPIGRLVRLVIGVFCLYALWEIVRFADIAVAAPFSTLDSRFSLLLAPLCIFNYVVNIGFARNWGHWPLIASLAFLGVAAAMALLISGQFDSPILGIPLNLWLGYFYGHLGLSFVLSALIATPGCEMRAIPELLGRISARPSVEHHCPVAILAKIDAWEQRRTSQTS